MEFQLKLPSSMGLSSSLYSQHQSQAGLVLNIPGALVQVLVLPFPCCVTL